MNVRKKLRMHSIVVIWFPSQMIELNWEYIRKLCYRLFIFRPDDGFVGIVLESMNTADPMMNNVWIYSNLLEINDKKIVQNWQ